MLILTSYFMVEARSQSASNSNKLIEEEKNGTDGRIYGWVETQGRCMVIGIPNLKIACGKTLFEYEIVITDEYGFFEFCNLPYSGNKGTTYLVWILPGQKVIFPGIKKATLTDENPEEKVYYFVYIWPLSKNKGLSEQINQQFKNLVHTRFLIDIKLNFLLKIRTIKFF